MNETLILAGDLLAGILLGTFFFGGLWWTIRMDLSSEWSGLVFAGSFVIRAAASVVGYFLPSRPISSPSL